MRGAVLDAFALLAWLGAGAGAAQVEGLLEEAQAGAARLSMAVMGAGGVCCRLMRLGRGREAEALWRELLRGRLPLRVMPATARRVRGAAELKGRYPWPAPTPSPPSWPESWGCPCSRATPTSAPGTGRDGAGPLAPFPLKGPRPGGRWP